MHSPQVEGFKEFFDLGILPWFEARFSNKNLYMKSVVIFEEGEFKDNWDR